MSNSTSINNTLGILLIGVILCAALWGISLLQAYHYYNHYRSDPRWLKLVVAVVFVADTTHQVLISYSIHWYLVQSFGNVDAISQLSGTMVTEIFVQAVTIVLVQCFFVHRIWTLSGRKTYIIVPMVALISCSFALYIVFGIKACKLKTFAELSVVRALTINKNIFTVLTDISISVLMCIILHRSKTGLHRSNMMLNRLITYSVNTGLLNSACAVTGLVTFLVLRQTSVWLVMFFLIGRLYSNAMLAVLNARHELRSIMNGDDLSVCLKDLQTRIAAPGHGAFSGQIVLSVHGVNDASCVSAVRFTSFTEAQQNPLGSESQHAVSTSESSLSEETLPDVSSQVVEPLQ
ncbi:hypothetical protein C8Q80DRAFT_1125659 [Daedaleopsis nitida]|nr:hypothetical protein C8Q80DRAFT_1125659 [Daedaleopsis nitida]